METGTLNRGRRIDHMEILERQKAASAVSYFSLFIHSAGEFEGFFKAGGPNIPMAS